MNGHDLNDRLLPHRLRTMGLLGLIRLVFMDGHDLNDRLFPHRLRTMRFLGLIRLVFMNGHDLNDRLLPHRLRTMRFLGLISRQRLRRASTRTTWLLSIASSMRSRYNARPGGRRTGYFPGSLAIGARVMHTAVPAVPNVRAADMRASTVELLHSQVVDNCLQQVAITKALRWHKAVVAWGEPAVRVKVVVMSKCEPCAFLKRRPGRQRGPTAVCLRATPGDPGRPPHCVRHPDPAVASHIAPAAVVKRGPSP